MYNTNLMQAISHNAELGTQREAFLVNQVKSAFYNRPSILEDDLLLSSQGDFLIQNRYTVEIGSKNKSFDQIKEIPDSFVVADDIEVGFGNKVPLWLFGNRISMY